MKKQWILPLLAALALAFPARAADFEGYLVKIAPRARLFSAESQAALPEMEEVYAPENVYRVDSAEDVEALRRAGMLLCAEPNDIITLESVPDDPELENQWYLDAIGAPWCWARGTDGAGVRVGVVDSGISAGHADFAGVPVIGRNYVSRQGEDPEDFSDTVSHGTFVGGIIAAGTNNGEGVAGIAPGAQLVALRCFDQSNNSTLSDIIQAIYSGVDDFHCDVLNMSFGGTTIGGATLLHEAIRYAYDQGVILIASAGNLESGKTSTGNDSPMYPAGWDEVIGVGAVTPEREVALLSYQNNTVWVTAPGTQIRGLWYTGGYATRQGTSFSAPMVSAAAALAIQEDPALTPEGFAARLRESAVDLGPEGYDNAYGWGMLDLRALLTTAWEEKALYALEQRAEAYPEARAMLACYDAAGRFLGTAERALPLGTVRSRLLTLSGWTPLLSAEEFRKE